MFRTPKAPVESFFVRLRQAAADGDIQGLDGYIPPDVLVDALGEELCVVTKRRGWFRKTEVRTLSPGVEALVGVYLDHLGSSAKTGCDLGKTLFRTNFAASPRELNRALWGYGELPPDMQSEGCGLMSPATAQEIAPIIRHALASEDLEPELRDALPALAELCERCQPDEFVVISYG